MGSFVVDGAAPPCVIASEAKQSRRHTPRLWPWIASSASGLLAKTSRAMNDVILREIADFCRRTGVAESTFGRRAVNDGKLASRLRNGGRITTDTLDRIRAFMAENRGPSLRSPVIER